MYICLHVHTYMHFKVFPNSPYENIVPSLWASLLAFLQFHIARGVVFSAQPTPVQPVAVILHFTKQKIESCFLKLFDIFLFKLPYREAL